MAFVIRVQGLVSGDPSPYDGEYLKQFDFDGCELGEMNVVTVADPTAALRFEDTMAALEFWRQIDPREPTRADGLPNRPLSAFTVTVEPV